jgi:hypothetical protein
MNQEDEENDRKAYAKLAELLEARVLAEARTWLKKQPSAADNPYRKLLALEKAKPFGTLFST